MKQIVAQELKLKELYSQFNSYLNSINGQPLKKQVEIMNVLLEKEKEKGIEYRDTIKTLKRQVAVQNNEIHSLKIINDSYLNSMLEREMKIVQLNNKVNEK